jgi:hypothetical protein
MSYLIYDHRRNGLTCLELSPNETKKCLALIGEKTPAPIGLRPTRKNIFEELDNELKQKTLTKKLKKAKKANFETKSLWLKNNSRFQ